MDSGLRIQEKIDVVYPLSGMAKGPDDFELRYSLRSLERQPWIGKVFLVGQVPKWIHDVHHIKCTDYWNAIYNKDQNIIKKMLCACVDERVSDPFVANSDDQYWLKEVAPEDMLIPPRENPCQLNKYLLPGRGLNVNRPFSNRWVKRQYDTLRFMRENKKSEIPFDGHVPYLIQKGKYLKTMAAIPWETGSGLLIVAYHGWNFQEDFNGYKIEQRDGVLVRIRADFKTEEIEEKAKDALFLNHNNKALSIGLTEFLKKKFPAPSRWE